MLARVLDQPVSQVGELHLLLAVGIAIRFRQAFVALGLNRSRAIFYAFLYERHHIGLGLIVFPLGIFFGGRLLPQQGFREIVHGVRDVQQPLREAPHALHRPEVVFVLREILGHGNQLPANFVPLREHHLRRTWRRRSFWRIGLGMRKGARGPRRQNQNAGRRENRFSHVSLLELPFISSRFWEAARENRFARPPKLF